MRTRNCIVNTVAFKAQISLASIFIASAAPAPAQIIDFDTGDKGIDTALEEVSNKAIEKSAVETIEKLAQKYGDDVFKDITKNGLKGFGKATPLSLFFDVLTTSKPTYRFAHLVPDKEKFKIIPDEIISEALQEAGINQATFANNRDYDLRSPGGLARFNADIRKKLLKSIWDTEFNGLIYPLLAEIENYSELSAKQMLNAKDAVFSNQDEVLSKETPVNNGVDDTLFDSIKAEIISEVTDYCKLGSSVMGEEKAFSLNSVGNLKVVLGQFQCQWEFINHAFCGAKSCEVREYRVEGSDSTLVRSYYE